ncbi:MAG: ribonuclease HI family protein [Pseudomonadota bacterium]
MHDLSLLTSLAHKAELRAARAITARDGVAQDDALLMVLRQVAGAGGLERLLAQRQDDKIAAMAGLASKREQKASALALRHARHDGPATPWRAWFDGSAHPNPGRCGIGGVLIGPAGIQIEISHSAGYGNSSEAEYLALIAVLQAAVEAGAKGGLTIYGDSRSVIDDVSGPDSAAAVSLLALRASAQALITTIDKVALRWIPRHKNAHADALSQRAVAAHGLAID